MVRVHQDIPFPRHFLMLLLAVGLLPGCGIVPRSRMEESQKLSQLLRSENARLKDQVLALQGQNRDYADRAVDDLRRLTAREQAIERLEGSVLAYQEDRERLAAAYEQLTVSLGRPPDSARTATGRKPEGQLLPRVGSEPPEPEHPIPKGITRVENQDASR